MQPKLLFVSILLLCTLTQQGYAQKPALQGQALIDSLLLELPKAKQDTNKVKMLNSLSFNYSAINPSEGIKYAEEGLALSEKLGWKKGMAHAYSSQGVNYNTQSNYSKALEWFLKALKIDEEIGSKNGIASNTINIGNVYLKQSNYPKALEYYLKALHINEEIGNKIGIANIAGNIGNVYFLQSDYPKALEYYLKALNINEEIRNKNGIAGSTVGIGNVYSRQSNYPKALEYYLKALSINEEIGNKKNIANNTGNIGNVYSSQGNYPKALEYFFRALKINEEIGNKKSLAYNIGNIGETYLKMVKRDSTAPDKQQWLQTSINHLLAATKTLKDLGAWDDYQSISKALSEAQALQGNYMAAYATYQQHVLFKDSVFNMEKNKQITRLELKYEFSKREDSLKYQQAITDGLLKQQTLLASQQQQALKLNQQQLALSNKEKDLQRLAYLKTQADLQVEQSKRKENEKALIIAEKEKDLQKTKVDLQLVQLNLKDSQLNSQKIQNWFYIGGIVLLAMLSFLIFHNFKNQKRANATITTEKQKSDALLLNILPAEVAEELKQKGEINAQQFDNVSVLFTDFVNFTGISETLTPKQLVNEIHQCFTVFDTIIEKNGLEKIKTIGDAYLAVCGLPNEHPLHAQKTVQAALEIRDFIANRKQKGGEFDIRIGIHSGPLVAGIVGVKKFAYDIWGDTVNTAARMEQHGEADKINISGATYEIVQNDFACTYRGKVKAKNKGEIDMYFVE
jgi:class 3 adenylate cyclase